MLKIIGNRCQGDNTLSKDLPPVVVTPDMGLIHPVHYRGSENPYFVSPAAYMQWRKSNIAKEAARQQGFQLADDNAPVVAVLLYRKHVITEQPYILDLLTAMEKENVIPVPIFINGVEAHTIVRDYLTSHYEITQVSRGNLRRPKTYKDRQAVRVDAIVNVSAEKNLVNLFFFLLLTASFLPDYWFSIGRWACGFHASWPQRGRC